MKKLICTVCAAAFACFAALCGCSMGEATVNYTLSEDGTYYLVSGVSGNTGALTQYEIPETYCGEDGVSLPVKEIGDSAFYGCTSLWRVTIPESVTRIGNLAFALCSLEAVEIPSGVTEIGYSAFGMCSSLKSVVVPESVTSLGERAFYCCSRLERAEVYAQITDLKHKTFYNSMATVGGNVFTSTALTELVLPATLERIAATALDGNAITDIYFMGTEEEWDAVYFYTYEEDDDGNVVEITTAMSEALDSSTVQVHYNYTPAQE